MKQTLQNLKHKQGLQSGLGILRFRTNMKHHPQRYTLSNFVFASTYNSQFSNYETWRLRILSDFDDDKDAVYLADLTFAGKEYPTILRRCVHMKKTSRPTLRLFMIKSASEEYSFPVFFNERKP